MAQARKSTSRSTTSKSTRSKATLSSTETGRNAENVVNLGTEVMRDFIATGAGEAQKAQQQVFAISREGAENLARSADAATRSLNEAMNLSRENIEACMECSNSVANITRTISSEVYNSVNSAFSESVELSKEIFACRTINDLFELQTKYVRNSIDNFFSDSMKFSEMAFQLASEAAEPLNERIADTTERLSRSLAAA